MVKVNRLIKEDADGVFSFNQGGALEPPIWVVYATW